MPISFYDILGVAKNAGPDDIKKSYRKLAMQYHPDRNPSPDAHKQFVAIKAAYETLSDPAKKRMYDLRQQMGVVFRQKPSANEAPPMSAEELRRKYWESPAGQKRRKELDESEAIYNKIIFGIKLISILALCFSAFLMIEKWAGTENTNQIVQSIELERVREYSFSDNLFVEVQTQNYLVRTNFMYADCIEIGDTLSVYISPFLKLVTQIGLKTECNINSSTEFDPRRGLFGGTFVIVVLIFILSLVVIFVNHRETKLGLGLLNLLFFIVISFLLGSYL